VISTLLRIASILCTIALVFSFAAFAADSAGDGSKKTVAQIAAADGASDGKVATTPEALNEPSPAPRVERVREKQHSAVRELADDVNDVLTAPFASIAGDSIWPQRIVSGLLALLVFGLGLGYVARAVAARGV
jgi:hypothetical protein